MKRFKKILQDYRINGYIVPKNDEYFNEYVNSSQDRLKFISNFSGSAGFALILENQNYLFTDGRYTIQANNESGKKFKVITIPKKFPKDVIKTKKKIIVGFDPKLHTERQLKLFFEVKNVDLVPISQNLVDKVWMNKPKEVVRPFFKIALKHAGKSTETKIQKVKKALKENKADYLLVTAPENVAWLLNIRGGDSSFSPIPNARLLISKKGKINIFTNRNKLKNLFNDKNIEIFDEADLERVLNRIYRKKIWLDRLSCAFIYKNIITKRGKVLDKIDPIYFFKSIKNKTEIKNIKKSHLIDGVALTKFIFWLKKNFNSKKITEISAQNKLESFRKMHISYKFPSFSTISGSGPNGAIIHYKASKKTNRRLVADELYLVDSGGQYSFGTTDVTRTISFKNKSKYLKEIYTRVLKGNIAVSKFKIKKNSTGAQIDKNARKFLNQINLDYPHGTGHGIGYFLNVHEGPQSLSRNNKIKLKKGMVVSNEPGYYKKGSFGIRIENLIYIKNNKFEELTIVPIEKDLIYKKILSNSEINWINNYHKKVEKSLKRFMSLNEKKYLTKACSPI